jgi:hypothetical protein
VSTADCIVCAHRSPSPRAGFIAGLAYQRAGLVRLCEEHHAVVSQGVGVLMTAAEIVAREERGLSKGERLP